MKVNKFIPSFNPDPKPVKQEKKKKPWKYTRKATGEKEVFLSIWNERNQLSFINDEYIPEPSPINFLHVLPKAKNKYPEFKLYKKNIVLGTPIQHVLWDNFRSKCTGREWDKMHQLEQELLIEYKEQHEKK